MSSLSFNAVLLDISNQLSADQLAQLKFLCKDMIGKRDLEKTDSGLRLFQLLTERGSLGPANTDTLCRLLEHIHRPDLRDKLQLYESLGGSTEDQPSESERVKLDIATEVMSENVGKAWRKLGRRLGVSEVKLESVAKRHPTELDETLRELLREWRRSRGPGATAQELITALRACQLNLTADKVEHETHA